MVMGGGSMTLAAERVIQKGRRIAAHLVEAAPEDMIQADGGFAVAGVPEKKVTWRQIAAAAYGGRVPPGMDPGLQETVFFDPRREAWGFGAHVAMVRIDRETGKPSIEKLVLVDDCGVIINPMIVEGQVHGSVMQGLGSALLESIIYDEDGQPLTTNLVTYLIPTAIQPMPLVSRRLTHPAPSNPLGAKGAGEGGCIGMPPAILNAVRDALRPYGVTRLDLPLSQHRVWQAIHESSEQA
jgi:carbon-monoxide dehydrogenase large subunit